MRLLPAVFAAALAASGPVLAAGERGRDGVDERALELGRAAQTFLAARKLEALKEKEARAFLGYRVLEGRILMRSLKAHLSRNEGTRVVLRGHEDQALEVMRAAAVSQRRLLDEVAAFTGKFTKQIRGISYLEGTLPLPPEDQKRARDLGFGTPGLNRPFRVQLAQFLLLGHCDDGDSSRVVVAPTLSDLDPREADQGFALLSEAFQEADAKVAKQPHLAPIAIEVLAVHAEALLRKGRTAEAIEKWQKILDSYPASTLFGRYEKRIAIAKRDAETFANAVKECDDSGIAAGLSDAFEQRVLTAGAEGVRLTVVDIELRCHQDPAMKPRWASVYSSAGLYAAGIGDCETFRLMFEKFIAAGGEEASREAHTRRYAPECAAP